MCIRIVELFAVCKCVYHIHGIDQCNSYGMLGHQVQDKVILVGYACRQHSFSSVSTSQSSSIQGSPSGPPLDPQRFGQLPRGLGAQIRQMQAYYDQRGYVDVGQGQQSYSQYVAMSGNGYSR